MKRYGEVALGVECALPAPGCARRAWRAPRALALLGALAAAGALLWYGLYALPVA